MSSHFSQQDKNNILLEIHRNCQADNLLQISHSHSPTNKTQNTSVFSKECLTVINNNSKSYRLHKDCNKLIFTNIGDSFNNTEVTLRQTQIEQWR